MADCTIIFPFQLFDPHPAVTKSRAGVIVEEGLVFGDPKVGLKFHQQIPADQAPPAQSRIVAEHDPVSSFATRRYLPRRATGFQFAADRRERFQTIRLNGIALHGTNAAKTLAQVAVIC